MRRRRVEEPRGWLWFRPARPILVESLSCHHSYCCASRSNSSATAKRSISAHHRLMLSERLNGNSRHQAHWPVFVKKVKRNRDDGTCHKRPDQKRPDDGNAHHKNVYRAYREDEPCGSSSNANVAHINLCVPMLFGHEMQTSLSFHVTTSIPIVVPKIVPCRWR